MSDLSYQILVALLDYNSTTGVFTWKHTDRRCRAGAVAGKTDDKGRVVIGFKGRRYKASRLAWFYYFGEWPNGLVDHEDGNPANNAIENLRIATYQQNAANSKPRSHMSKGVVIVDGKYRASIMVDGRRLALGLYDTEAGAAEAYRRAAEKHFGEFARCH